MANRMFKPGPVSLSQGVVFLYGKFTLGASGAVADQSCMGFSLVKTGSETGRYTVTLEDSYVDFLGLSCVLAGAADTTYTASAGVTAIVRNVDVTSGKSFDLQLINDALEDAEGESGAVVYVEIKLKNSSV